MNDFLCLIGLFVEGWRVMTVLSYLFDWWLNFLQHNSHLSNNHAYTEPPSSQMSSSLSTSDNFQDETIINSITPTTATVAATPTVSVPTPRTPTPQFRCNYLPYQLHQFFTDDTPDLLAYQLQNLHLPTVEGQLQIRAVMNMIHFFAEIKLSLIDCIVMIKSILDCKTGAQMESIRIQMDHAVANGEIYPEVAQLFDYIVCTTFDDGEKTSQWDGSEYIDAEECEHNQLQDIEMLVSRNLTTMENLLEDMIQVVTQTGLRHHVGNAEEVPKEIRRVDEVDEIKDLSRFDETPTHKNEVVLEQAEEVHKVNKIDIVEDGEVKDVAEKISKGSDTTKDFASEVVEEVVEKVDGTLEGDLKRFTNSASEKIVSEAVGKIEGVAKEDAGQIAESAEAIAQEIFEKVVDEVVEKLETESIEEVIEEAFEDVNETIEQESKNITQERTETNFKNTKLSEEVSEKINDRIGEKVVEIIAEELADKVIEKVTEKMTKDVTGNVAGKIPLHTIQGSGGEVEVVAEKVTLDEYRAFSSFTE